MHVPQHFLKTHPNLTSPKPFLVGRSVGISFRPILFECVWLIKIDADRIEASFKKGVLTVKLREKLEAQKPAKKIKVKVA